jgi:hypothetical protein
MGREIKRVAMDFDYPINQMIWKGYANPFRGLECTVCGGTGESLEVKRLSEDWYGLDKPENRWCDNITQDEVQALVDNGRLMDFTRVPRNDQQRAEVDMKIAEGGNSWLPYDNGYVPTAEEVNEWAQKGLGHDCTNKWICVKARAERLGIAEMECSCCEGEGVLWPDEKYAKLAEDFEPIDPPVGDGYQLWSTTTEGTPMSPVFAKPEDLARWLDDNKASTFGRSTTDYETWLNFIRGLGWAPSMIATSQKLESGVSASSAP